MISFAGVGNAYANLFQLGTMHLAPSGPAMDAFVKFAKNFSTSFDAPWFQYRIHETEV
jgi:hypothetical protein